jgi:molybdenum cofactor cytidylyltransferase
MTSPAPSVRPPASQPIVCIVLAAGQARRMGRLKQLLPWGATTVLGQTVRHITGAGLSDVLVVTGFAAAEVAAEAARHGAAVVHNPHFAAGEMLSSLQVGVRTLLNRPVPPVAVIVALGDQPLIPPSVYRALVDAFASGPQQLVAPQYGQQRGNPVLIGAAHFPELLALPRGAAPRDLLRRHATDLLLVPVDSPAVLVDLDRPEEYERYRPEPPVT